MVAGGRERAEGIVVFSVLKASTCSTCGDQVPVGGILRMEKQQPLCLECADLGHLMYLPSGDAALTRRSRKRSTLSAVVVRFSRARKRYERQGILVEQAAVDLADQILSQYPRCPREEAASIAQHACQKYSGRVGRSAAARQLDPVAVAMAVAAHVRHAHSEYDKLLAQGWERIEARRAVAGPVQLVMDRWVGR